MRILVIIMAMLLFAAGGYWLGQQRTGPSSTTSSAADSSQNAADGSESEDAASGEGERKILYYRNPMGLPDTSPVPKKDSMGMDYIPVYEGEEPETEGAVKVSPARLQTLGVKTARAQMKTLDADVRAVGQVVVNERSIHDIAPRFSGWIEQLDVDAQGDPVRRGQRLFTVYSPQLLSARQELVIARRLVEQSQQSDAAARDNAQRLLTAARQRLQNWQVNPERMQENAIAFYSPVSGIVLQRDATEGMRFQVGRRLLQIASLDQVWVKADVYEQDLIRVKAGEPAVVEVDAFPGRTFSATVDYIYPTLNSGTRTTPVRLILDNPDGLLRPGMFAHVELVTGGETLRLTVPKSAVIDSGEEQVVFLAQGEGRFVPQQVETGLHDRFDVEILHGLSEGDEVVVAANFMIDAESNLKAALAGFSEPESDKPQYEAMGNLESVDLSDLSVSMTHDPIEALQWPEMTMDFELADSSVVQGILPGERIHFVFEDHGDGRYVITRIDQAERYQAHGHLESVNLDDKTVSMTHDPIEALQWPEMTMDFQIAGAEVVQGIDMGQRIEFTFEDHGQGGFVITDIQPENKEQGDAGANH